MVIHSAATEMKDGPQSKWYEFWRKLVKARKFEIKLENKHGGILSSSFHPASDCSFFQPAV